MWPLVSGTKGTHEKSLLPNKWCGFVNVEVLSQIKGANSNRFNLLRLLPQGIEENRSINTKIWKTTVCKAYSSSPYSFYDSVNHIDSLARWHNQLIKLIKLNIKYPGLFLIISEACQLLSTFACSNAGRWPSSFRTH